MTAKKETKHVNKAFPEPSEATIKAAREEGIKEAITESTKTAYSTGANEGYGDEPTTGPVITGTKEVFHLQHIVDMHPDELEATLNGKEFNGVKPMPLSDAQIAGLLEVERSGKNRTDVVKVFCKRLKIKSPSEVTAAGPAYTNDITRL